SGKRDGSLARIVPCESDAARLKASRSVQSPPHSVSAYERAHRAQADNGEKIRFQTPHESSSFHKAENHGKTTGESPTCTLNETVGPAGATVCCPVRPQTAQCTELRATMHQSHLKNLE